MCKGKVLNGGKNMLKQFLDYAIPSALAMCIASLNTVLDGVFLGQGVGDRALAAVNVVMPLTIAFFGMATMVAVGGGSLVSKNFGAEDDQKAVNIFRQVMKALVMMSLSLSIVCVLFAKPIVSMMGATSNLVELSAEYLRYYALFCLPSLLGIALGSFLRNDNKPRLAMVATIIGTIVNITLNYIFIFELGLGIKSAAIATGIGQTVTVCMMLPHFLFKKGKLTFGSARIERLILKEVFGIGFPSFVAEAAFSVIILLHNVWLTRVVGEAGLSAYAVVNYITTNIYMIVLGVTFGAQPLISYNFGAKQKEKMLAVYHLSIKTNVMISAVFLGACLIFGKTLIGIFTSDPKIIEIAYLALNMTAVAYFMIGINLTKTVYYQAIEMPKYSNLIGALRSLIVLPVVLIVASILFGEVGIWMSMAITEVITLLVINKVVNIENCTMKSMEQYSM